MDNKKTWIAPTIETLNVNETQYTFMTGTVKDGGTYEDNCEYAGDTYS